MGVMTLQGDTFKAIERDRTKKAPISKGKFRNDRPKELHMLSSGESMIDI